MQRKQVIGYIESDGTQILYSENSCSSRVSFPERMYLPDSRHKLCEVLHYLTQIQSAIIELAFLLHVIFQCHSQILVPSIKYRIATQHPFFLSNIVSSQLSSVLEHTLENVTMDGNECWHTRVTSSILMNTTRSSRLFHRPLRSAIHMCLMASTSPLHARMMARYARTLSRCR